METKWCGRCCSNGSATKRVRNQDEEKIPEGGYLAEKTEIVSMGDSISGFSSAASKEKRTLFVLQGALVDERWALDERWSLDAIRP